MNFPRHRWKLNASFFLSLHPPPHFFFFFLWKVTMSVSKFAVRIHCSSHLSEECKTQYFVISKALKIKSPNE